MLRRQKTHISQTFDPKQTVLLTSWIFNTSLLLEEQPHLWLYRNEMTRKAFFSLVRMKPPAFLQVLLCSRHPGVWGENRKPRWEATTLSAGYWSVWTFREFGYFGTRFHGTSISCYGGKNWQAVLVFQTACVILAAECVDGFMEAGCSSVLFVSKAASAAGRERRR